MVDIGISKMKNYLANAMECEKNVYIWSDAMKCVNDKMKQIYKEQNETNEKLKLVQGILENSNITCKGRDKKKASDIRKSLSAPKKRKRRCIFMLLLMPLIPLICFVWGLIAIPIIMYSESVLLSALACICVLAFLETLPIILFIISVILFIISIANVKKHTDKSIVTRRVYITFAKGDKEKQLTQQRDKLVEHRARLCAAEQCVTDWQDKIHKSYKQAFDARQKLYSLNVLDARYRNFFCVAAFFDYIQTGRVVTVNGYGGLAATLDRDLKHWETISYLNDIRAIARDTNLQQRYLVEQAREANRIQQQISDQISDLNRNVEYLSVQQARTTDAANRIYSQLRY